MRRWHPGLSVLFCLVWLLCSATGLKAAEYTVTPALTVQSTYDDNVFFKEAGDLELRVSPSLEVGSRTDRMHVEASAALDIWEYKRLNELDNTEKKYGLSMDLTPGDLWQTGVSGTYVDDYTFVDTLEQTGVLADRSRRKRGTVEPYVTFFLDARNSLRGAYSFIKTNYDLDRYPDYRVHGANLAWYRVLMNERTTFFASAGLSDVKYRQSGGDTEESTYRAVLGLEHQFSETLKGTVSAGPTYTDSDYYRGATPVSEDSTDVYFDGTLEWHQERLSLSAHVDYDIDHSIYGENITRSRIRGTLGYRWTERFRGHVSTAYYRSETDGLVQDEKRQTYWVRPAVTFRLTENIDLRGGYRYTWTENRVTDDTQERHRLGIQLAMDWPVLFD
jgi:hypothetical protein